MIKGIITFLVIYALLYAGITIFRSLTNREKLNFGKMFAYCSSIALVAVVVLAGIVLLF